MKTLLILLQLSAIGTDGYYTEHNMMNRGFIEYNPLERPVTHNTTTLVIGNLLEAGGAILGQKYLRKHHHEKLADAWAIGEISGHTTGAIVSKMGAK